MSELANAIAQAVTPEDFDIDDKEETKSNYISKQQKANAQKIEKILDEKVLPVKIISKAETPVYSTVPQALVEKNITNTTSLIANLSPPVNTSTSEQAPVNPPVSAAVVTAPAPSAAPATVPTQAPAPSVAPAAAPTVTTPTEDQDDGADEEKPKKKKQEETDGVDPMMKYLSTISQDHEDEIARKHVISVFTKLADDSEKGIAALSQAKA